MPYLAVMEIRRDRMYEITSLGRRLDPSYPTNRAVLVLLPVAGLLAALAAVAAGAGPAHVLWRGIGGLLAAFGAWALAREIAPDDELFGAFGAMVAAFAAWLLVDAALLPLFAALFYARLVVRSTGLRATLLDSLFVTALALFAAWSAGSPWPAAAGAAAFVLDAVLRPGFPRQWLFAGICAAGAVALTSAGLAPRVIPIQPDLVPRTLATVVTVGAIALISATRTCRTRCDTSDAPLSVARVRGAQSVTLVAALATAASGSEGIEAGALVWATLGAVTLTAAARGVGGRSPDPA